MVQQSSALDSPWHIVTPVDQKVSPGSFLGRLHSLFSRTESFLLSVHCASENLDFFCKRNIVNLSIDVHLIVLQPLKNLISPLPQKDHAAWPPIFPCVRNPEVVGPHKSYISDAPRLL